MNQNHLNDIISQFVIEGSVDHIKPLGNGLINTTYKVTTSQPEAPDYVLQKINHAIFTNVEMLMDNIVAVTTHLRKKLEQEKVEDIERKCLEFVLAKSGKYYHYDGENYWRIMKFIPETTSMTAVTAETARIVGQTFGEFQSQLADIPISLGETIKDFHNMEFRLYQLREAVKANKSGRLDKVQQLVDAIEEKADKMLAGEKLHTEGKIQKRICHCDTKVDNILFDKDGKVLCVIDLDTVMPNYIFSDYGDYLRSAANTGKEDDECLDNVNFNMEIFKAFTEGYISTAKAFLTPVEIEYLPYAAELFPYMQTVRFLADYIDGDLYYKTAYDEHNRVRALAQWKLFTSVESHEEEMKQLIKNLVK